MRGGMFLFLVIGLIPLLHQHAYGPAAIVALTAFCVLILSPTGLLLLLFTRRRF